MSKTPLISFCIPVYNESLTLIDSLRKISKGLFAIFGKGKYEIIVVDNGSTDNTFNLLKKIKDPAVYIYSVKKRGQGLAYKKSIQAARGKYLALSAIDLPFGFDDLKFAMLYWDKYDFIFGSKKHPKSKVLVPYQRKIASIIYGFLISVVFDTKIRDTQGSVFLKKESIDKILKFCDSPNAFFTAQIAINAIKNNMKVKEIPVNYNYFKKNARKSKYNIFLDGPIIFSSLIKELYKSKKINKND